MTCPTKKLDWKYYGPYKIISRIKQVVYRLKLPKLMKIHNVFHVFLLELCEQPKEGNIPPPPSIKIDGKKNLKLKNFQQQN